MKVSKPKILLTGRPGVGKTTVIKKVAHKVRNRVGGFYTEEIREKGKRKGFLIRTLTGESSILAHVNHRGPFRVGRYGVDVNRFEEIVASCLERALDRDEVIIIDEIGKMELFSKRFQLLADRVLASDRIVLAVIHQGNDCFTRKIRILPDIEIWTVTEKNRDDLPSYILKRINLGGERENFT